MKKMFAMLLALVMAMSMAATAFAAGGADHKHTITITGSQEGYTYKAYQIFTGDLSDKGVLSNVEWGSAIPADNINAFLAELKTLTKYALVTDAKTLATELADNSAMDDPDVIAFADIAAKYVDPEKGVTSDWDADTQHYLITGLADGYYLVVNTVIPNEPDTTYSRHIVEVVRNITVTHKGDFPKVVKKIIEPQLELDANQASIGEDVNYEITGTMPGNIQYYKTYKYIFHDTLSKGLTFNNDVKVTVNDKDVTDAFTVHFDEDFVDSSVTGAYAGGTEITISIADLLTVAATAGTITKDTEVVVTYSAKVNENAVVASTGNPNKVYLEYDNNPNTNGAGGPDVTGKTPEDEVKTYVTELTILKKDGAGNALKGAEFTLTGDAVKTMVVTKRAYALAGSGETGTHWKLLDGTFTNIAPADDDPSTTEIDESTKHLYADPDSEANYLLKETDEIQYASQTVNVQAYVGDDGYLTFTGLGAGVYTLTESVTPDGFNTIAPITFTVTFNPNTGKFNTVDNNLIMVETDNTLYAEIINVAGNTLPSTGGIGTTLFYVFGGLMVAGALVLLITKKRMIAE